MSTNTNEVQLELYIIRHGQTFGNLGIEQTNVSYIDKHDPLLTEKGEHQVKLLGERFANYPFDAVYSSALRRAMQTATSVVSQQPENGAKEIRVMPLLNECGAGEEYLGLSFTELKEMFPLADIAEGFDKSDKLITLTRGWSDAQQLERAKKVLDYLTEKHHSGEKVAVVAHAAFNTFLFHCALGLDPEKVIFDPHFLNTGVTKIVFFKKGTGRYDLDVQLVYCNDLSHLYKDYPEYLLEQCYF